MIASLEKKLKFIEERIVKVVDSTKAIYAALEDKFESRREELRKGKS